MDEAAFSPTEAVRAGWAEMKPDLGLYLGVAVAAAIASLFFGSLSGWFASSDAMQALLSLLAQVVHAFFVMGWIRVALRRLDGATPSVRDLVPDANAFLNFLATYFLYGLIVAVGLLFLIVPGIYLAVRYGLAPFLVVDRKIDPIEAVRQSAMLTRHARWSLFLLGLLCLGINLLGALACGIGLLFTVPLTVVAATYAYRVLRDRAEILRPAGPAPQPLPT